jgi:hypothetical protein
VGSRGKLGKRTDRIGAMRDKIGDKMASREFRTVSRRLA